MVQLIKRFEYIALRRVCVGRALNRVDDISNFEKTYDRVGDLTDSSNALRRANGLNSASVGIGAQISLGGKYFIKFDGDLTGATSITIGENTDLGDGKVKTEAVIFGVNSISLAATILGVYVFVISGGTVLVPVF